MLQTITEDMIEKTAIELLVTEYAPHDTQLLLTA